MDRQLRTDRFRALPHTGQTPVVLAAVRKCLVLNSAAIIPPEERAPVFVLIRDVPAEIEEYSASKSLSLLCGTRPRALSPVSSLG